MKTKPLLAAFAGLLLSSVLFAKWEEDRAPVGDPSIRITNIATSQDGKVIYIVALIGNYSLFYRSLNYGESWQVLTK